MSDIYLSLTETPAVVTLSQPVVSGALSSTVTVSNVVSVNVVTMPAITVQAAAPAVTTVAGTVTANVSGDWGVVVTSGIVGGTSNSGVIDLTGYPQNSLIEATLQISGGSAVRKFQEIDSQGQYPGADITLTKTFDGSTVVNFDPANSPSGVYVFRNPGGYVRFAYVSAGQGTNTQSYEIRAVRDPYYGLNRPISGTVTVGNSVTIGSLPAISGTVTANAQYFDAFLDANFSHSSPIFLDESGSGYLAVGIGSPLPISGTVTVGNTVTIGSLPAISGTVTAMLVGRDLSGPGSDRRVVVNSSGNTIVDIHAGDGSGPISNSSGLLVRGTVTVGNSVTIGSLPAISGTVTVGNTVTISALPSGSLTTRFGSVATANLAFITSAVTNTSRKYLLAQNISAGTVTIGIGFSPTTTQGIQLTAGGGLTFDAFCPTGAVYWLGAVTGAAFTILEG